MANRRREVPGEQLLGEIPTCIVGLRHGRTRPRPGRQVKLRREPENRHHKRAIRVEGHRSARIGYLPRQLADWLASLLDDEKVRIEGAVPNLPTPEAECHEGACPLALSVFAPADGEGLLSKREVHTGLDALHETVRRAYLDAQGCSDPSLILDLAGRLKALERQELLPETHLLIALLPGFARELQAAHAVEAAARFQDLLGSVVVGEPQSLDGLTLFPLLWPEPLEPPYVLLAEAIERNLAVVEEVDTAGSVPNLQVNNLADLPLLIPEGEILVGAKQDRVVNVTVLVAARSKFIVPVSCVEQGRWHYVSRHFRSAYAAPPTLRMKKMRSVHRSRRERGSAESDQGEVWDEIAQNLARLAAPSPTGSLTDGFAARQEQLEALRQGLKLPTEAAGILVARGKQVIGMDLFDAPATFQALWGRLGDAYLLEALHGGRKPGKAGPAVAQGFLRRAAACATLRTPSLGLGEEMEIRGEGLVGGGLIFDGRLCHLSAFGEPEQLA